MIGPVGDLTLLGRLAEASNGTFLGTDEAGGTWVYKPVAGERPLWDFPTGTLARREVAAYAVSEALGLSVVPTTVWYEGPLGEGSAQAWVDGGPTDLVDLLDPEALTRDWLPILAATADDRPVILAHRDDARLRTVALLDALINNADRKAGHLISDGDAVRGVDHGVSLHIEDKLRTVLWGWAGDPLTQEESRLLEVARGFSVALAPGLDDDEWEGVRVRAGAILAEGTLPRPSGRWPAIPWPPM